MKFSRREFFFKAIQGTAVIALPSVLISFLESCNNNLTGPSGPGVTLTNVQGTLSNGVVSVNIDSSSPLFKTGTAALVNFSNGAVLVDHPSNNTFNALSSICTHQGCQVSGYDSGSSQFICPCHGSRFDINGNVVSGPAPSPLSKYPIQISNNQILIKVG